MNASTSESTDSSAVGLPDIKAAVRLGWNMALAYHQPYVVSSPQAPSEESPPHLPGAGELHQDQERKTCIAEIQRASPISPAVGQVVAATSKEECKTALLALHEDTLMALETADASRATAYGLGRMLADTTLLVDKEHPETLATEFARYRLGNAYEWLDNLRLALPPGAADAVSASLKEWERWVGSSEATSMWPSQHEVVLRALHSQGKLWRQLLCGEKRAVDLLQPKDYEQAGVRMLRGLRGLAASFARSWWTLVVLASVFGGVYAIVRFISVGSFSATVATVVTLAGSLGISWSAAQLSLGQVATKVGTALWDAEVHAAIGVAATRLPHLGQPDISSPPATQAETPVA